MEIFRLNLIFFLLPLTILSHDLPVPELISKLKLSQNDLNERGKKEIKAFVDSNVWAGGYIEGNPQNPNGDSSYHIKMNYNGKMLSPLYICYAQCILPYVNSNLDVLEIGPGAGAWSKAIINLQPRTLTCVDALSATHNRFWNYVGYHNSIRYIQIKDFLLNELQDNSIDFVFSFGTFCHISSLMCYEYFKNLFKKLRPGAHCFIMYADFDKKNKFASKYNRPDHAAVKCNELDYFKYQTDANNFIPTWFHLGTQRAADVLQELGYVVIKADMDINERDPVVHFYKP